MYTDLPELARPAAFFGRALNDLRASPRLGWRLFQADARARHRRSLLGWAWLLLPAAAAALICVYLQSRRVFAVGPTELPYGVHVLTGVVLWQVFVEALNAPLKQLSAAKQMITRSRVPHEAVLLSGLYEVALNAVVRLAVLIAVLAAFRLVPAPSVALLPVGMIALTALGFTLGLAMAPLGLLYDDVRQAMMLATSFLFFLTPIVYLAPETGLLHLNPVTPLLNTTRSWIVSAEAGVSFFIVAGASLAGLALAWLLYRLAQPHVIARLE